jgi:hypothetical protein
MTTSFFKLNSPQELVEMGRVLFTFRNSPAEAMDFARPLTKSCHRWAVSLRLVIISFILADNSLEANEKGGRVMRHAAASCPDTAIRPITDIHCAAASCPDTAIRLDTDIHCAAINRPDTAIRQAGITLCSRTNRLAILLLAGVIAAVVAAVAPGIGSLVSAQPAPPTAIVDTDIVLVIDGSGSMAETDPHNLRVDAVRLFRTLAVPSDRIAIVQFGEKAEKLSDLTHPADGKALEGALSQISSRGQNTDLTAALTAGVELLFSESRTPSRKVMILLTDGRMDVSPSNRAYQGPEYQVATTREERARAANLESLRILRTGPLQDAVRLGWPVFTVAFAKAADTDLLGEIAGATGGQFFVATDTGELHRTLALILARLHGRQTIPANHAREIVIDPSVAEVTFIVSRGADGAAAADVVRTEASETKDMGTGSTETSAAGPGGTGAGAAGTGAAGASAAGTNAAGTSATGTSAAGSGGTGVTKIIDPRGRSYTSETADRLNGIWSGSGLYDVLTVKDPAPGVWQVTGSGGTPLAVALTDLKLVLEVRASAAGSPEVTAYFTEKGTPLPGGSAALRGLVIYASPKTRAAANGWVPLVDDGTGGDAVAADGRFTAVFPSLPPGTYRLTATAIAPTFRRQEEASFTVAPAGKAPERPVAASVPESPRVVERKKGNWLVWLLAGLSGIVLSRQLASYRPSLAGTLLDVNGGHDIRLSGTRQMLGGAAGVGTDRASSFEGDVGSGGPGSLRGGVGSGGPGSLEGGIGSGGPGSLRGGVGRVENRRAANGGTEGCAACLEARRGRGGPLMVIKRLDHRQTVAVNGQSVEREAPVSVGDEIAVGAKRYIYQRIRS